MPAGFRNYNIATRVVRIFPNAEGCLRLVRALAVEAHENWRRTAT
jgi:transposase-like protein